MMLSDKDLVKQDPISLYSPSNPFPTQTMFLSNIDQAVNFPVKTVFFYDVPPSSSTVDVAERVRKAVEEVLLVPYYFMAGRLHFNEETTRLELVCNNEGVLFVSASSRLELSDLGNLAQPNPSFHLLVHYGTYRNLLETPVFTVQVTRFKCGGFAIGFVTNHAVFDGKSASGMFHKLASICRGKQGALRTHKINNDRTFLKARTPPQINFPHNEYAKLSEKSCFTSSKRASRESPLSFSDKYTHKLFTFTSETLKSLKAQAGIECSNFEVVLAHIWRARSKATYGYYPMSSNNISNNQQDDYQENNSTVLFAVDIRDIISPPLPHSFVGNAVITAFARAKTLDLINGPLSFAVEMVKRGKERVTSEYIRSVIDWLEVYKGAPATHSDGGFYVSAWWKLRFNEVDFGYGRPRHAGPIVGINDEFVILLNDGSSCEGNNKTGINVWIGLEKKNMDRFCSFVFDL